MGSTILSEALLVAGGAALGATARYGAHELYSHWHLHRKKFTHPPLWGIVGVNVAASLVLGCLAASESTTRNRQLMVGTGFCGGMSTFSTFAVESLKLLQVNPRLAMVYIVVSNTGCILAAGAGFMAMKKMVQKKYI